MAIDWLEWKAKNTEQHIRHQGNDSEKLFGMKRLPVDGFCKDTITVYEFQGCIWHGHWCWRTKKHNGVNPINGKNLDDLYQRTQDKIRYIKDQGYNVVEMWECQWQASNIRDPELSRFIENRKRPCDGLVTMTRGPDADSRHGRSTVWCFGSRSSRPGWFEVQVCRDDLCNFCRRIVDYSLSTSYIFIIHFLNLDINKIH